MNTQHLLYPFALPRKAQEQLCRDTAPKGRPAARNQGVLRHEAPFFSPLSLHKHTENKLYKSIRHQGQSFFAKTHMPHASFLGTRPRRLRLLLGVTRPQQGCGREITFHLGRHSVNHTRQECEDRAGSPEPLVSHRRFQNATVLFWASAEDCQVLEAEQNPGSHSQDSSSPGTFWGGEL